MQEKYQFSIKAALVTDDKARAASVMPAMSSLLEIELFAWESLQENDLLDSHIFIFDVDISDVENIIRLKEIQKSLGYEPQTIFSIDGNDRRAESQVNALGSKHNVSRPLESDALVEKITDICTNEVDILAVIAANAPEKKAATTTLAIADIFDSISSSILRGGKLPTEELTQTTTNIVRTVSSTGMDTWLAAVRSHSSFTYKHVMVVTGFAAAFGLLYNMNQDDKERLTLGALLHDVGKTKVPLKILDKPGKLSAGELKIMRSHPMAGYEILSKNPSLGKEMAMIARSHHEYLDGSGYPDQLKGVEIPDIVRVITVVDIFSALIESRSYKNSLPPEQAYIVLQEMGGKLDQDIVRAFEPIALSQNANDLVSRLNSAVA
ncbi:MAG: HD domain-containing phosphohydrolase [Hyphomicrobiales bacterium]